MQLVFEFGSTDLAPVVDAIEHGVGNIPSEIRSLPNDSDAYTPTEDSFTTAAQKLKEGTIASVSLHPKSGQVQIPGFSGRQWSRPLVSRAGQGSVCGAF